MGLMKRLIRMRSSNLKVLITSATLDGDKVSKFFFDCPVLTVPGKLYPVEILYSNERPKSYIESCLKTAIGMITVFHLIYIVILNLIYKRGRFLTIIIQAYCGLIISFTSLVESSLIKSSRRAVGLTFPYINPFYPLLDILS